MAMWHCMHEGCCLDAAWGSGLENLRPILSETGLAAEGGIGGHQASSAAPHSTTPLHRSTLWTYASGENWGGVWDRKVRTSTELHNYFPHNQRVVHITPRETVAGNHTHGEFHACSPWAGDPPWVNGRSMIALQNKGIFKNASHASGEISCAHRKNFSSSDLAVQRSSLSGIFPAFSALAEDFSGRHQGPYP